jgi:hypothetical protein
MRFYLLTVEETQQFGQTWKIAPSVPLRGLLAHYGPTESSPCAWEPTISSPDRYAPLTDTPGGREVWPAPCPGV